MAGIEKSIDADEIEGGIFAFLRRDVPRIAVPAVMQCGDMGHYANAKNILSQHAPRLLKADEAAKIVGDLKDQVAASWYEAVRFCDVSE
jgi:hypothetical protein